MRLLTARLAQSVEHETLNLRVVGSSPTLGVRFFVLISSVMLVVTKKSSYLGCLLVYGYDSRYRCEMSRVQFPDRPLMFH